MTSGEREVATRREEVDTLLPEIEQALPASRRKGLIWWLSDAKRDATRKKRLQAITDEALTKSKQV